MKLCKEEEARVFSRCGYAMECELNVNQTKGFRLHVFRNSVGDKSRNAAAGDRFLRIELSRNKIMCFTWTPVSLSTLASYQTLPPEYASLHDKGWAEFWTDMMDTSKEYLSTYRIQNPLEIINILYLLLFVVNTAHFRSDSFMVVLFIVLMLVNFALCHTARIRMDFSEYIAKQQELVNDFAVQREWLRLQEYPAPTQRGDVAMEIRTVVEIGLCCNWTKVRRLYLSLPPENQGVATSTDAVAATTWSPSSTVLRNEPSDIHVV